MERQESVIFVERYEEWENGDGIRRSPGEFPNEPTQTGSETAETVATPKAIRNSSFAMAIYDAAKVCCGKKTAKRVALIAGAGAALVCVGATAYALLHK
jgi:hypothetical protein